MDKIKDTLKNLMFLKGHGISIVVPLHLTDKEGPRFNNWRWLRQYWKSHLPGAELIIGKDHNAEQYNIPFSKSVAVNDGVSRTTGDVIVLIDADVYIDAESILHCAKEIRLARKKTRNLWFMPYRQLYRLTEEVSKEVLNSNPNDPSIPSDPIDDEDFLNKEDFKGTPVTFIGHWYGAMIQVMPREAFDLVGGWDPRFRGWGAEDHAAMVAMDTLYGPHKTLPGRILHLWHPTITVPLADDPKGKRRVWANQGSSENNNALSGRYYWSRGIPSRMRRLVDEFKDNEYIVPAERQNVPRNTEGSC